MAYVILGIAGLFGVYLLLRGFVAADPASLLRGLRWGLMIVAAMFGVWLLFSGKLVPAMGALGALLGGAVRWQALINRLWTARPGGEAGRQEGQNPKAPGKMTREEAYEVLGLAPGATAAEIKAAHHRLMLKLHPDLGGSTWVASRINLARDVLLKQ